MRRAWTTCLVSVAIAALTHGVQAQWLNYPTPGIPRTADGTPDLSGLWHTTNGRLLQNLGADGVEIPMRPAAIALFRERQENHGKDRPSGRCVSHGITDFHALNTPTKIAQTPGVTI